MSKAKETLMFLANYNSWRRDGETKDMPSPTEIGAAIDDAVNLLRKYDELERENAELRSKLELLCDTIDAHEIESQSCDRDGYIYCDCLRNNAKLARAAIDARKEQP